MDTKNFEKKMETISPFELKNQLIDMADESLKKTARTMLNAGRGNPNWIATTPREAFFLLGQFGLEECRRVMNLPEGIAGIPEKSGIASRFEAFLKKNNTALIIGAFFMATDWVTSPITKKGRLIYALGLGILTALIHA